jgi:hypothetical protein
MNFEHTHTFQRSPCPICHVLRRGAKSGQRKFKYSFFERQDVCLFVFFQSSYTRVIVCVMESCSCCCFGFCFGGICFVCF